MPANFLASSNARAVYANGTNFTGQAVHFACWVNVHTTPAVTRGILAFIGDAAGTTYGISLGIEATTNKIELLRANTGGANSQLLGAAGIPLGEWVLVYGYLPANAVTDMTNAVIRSVVRGVAQTDGTGGTAATGTEQTHSGPIALGSRNYDSARVLDATIGMVRIWTGGAALSQVQVQALYDSGLSTLDTDPNLKFRADLTGTLTAEVGGAPTGQQGTITLDDRTGIPASLTWVNRRRMLNRRYAPRQAALGAIASLANLAGLDGAMVPVATVLAPNVVDLNVFRNRQGVKVRAAYLGETWTGSAIGYRLGEVDSAATRAPLLRNDHSTIVSIGFSRGCQGGPAQSTHTIFGTSLAGFKVQLMTLGRLAFSGSITNGTDRVPNSPSLFVVRQSPDGVENAAHWVNLQTKFVHSNWNISADTGADGAPTPSGTRTIRFGAANGSLSTSTRYYLMEYLEFGDRLTDAEIDELRNAYIDADIGIRPYRSGYPLMLADGSSSFAGQWAAEEDVSVPAMVANAVMPAETVLYNGSVPGQNTSAAGGSNDMLDDSPSYQEYIAGTYHTDYSVSRSIALFQPNSNDPNVAAPDGPVLVANAQTLVSAVTAKVGKVIVVGCNARSYDVAAQNVGETARLAVNAKEAALTGMWLYVPPLYDNGATGGDQTGADYTDTLHLKPIPQANWAAKIVDAIRAKEQGSNAGSGRLQRVVRV